MSNGVITQRARRPGNGINLSFVKVVTENLAAAMATSNVPLLITTPDEDIIPAHTIAARILNEAIRWAEPEINIRRLNGKYYVAYGSYDPNNFSNLPKKGLFK